MAHHPVAVKPNRWGTATHESCVQATDPHDAFLTLYRKQYGVKPDPSEFKKDQDGNLVYSKHINFRAKTRAALNPMVSAILHDDRLWAPFYRYKHRTEYYLESAETESFRAWHHRISKGHCLQIPEGKGYRNRLCLLPITDDQTYFIDEPLMKTLEELVTLYFGLEVKHIDVVSKGDNIIFKKNHFNHFSTSDIHCKLSQYQQSDPDLFGIVGVCFKIGIFGADNKVIHGEHREDQTAVCSFGKIGIYNKLSKNTPQWLTIRRAGKVLLHEIGRLFGLGICEYFRCLMNKDVVLDCVPMTLCPVCLNKLYFAMILRNEHRDTFEDMPSSTWLEMKEEEDFFEDECCYKQCKKDGTQGSPRISGLESYTSSSYSTTRQMNSKQRKGMGSKGVRIDPNTFNLYERYSNLAMWFMQHQCRREASWYKDRCADLRKALREAQRQPQQ